MRRGGPASIPIPCRPPHAIEWTSCWRPTSRKPGRPSPGGWGAQARCVGRSAPCGSIASLGTRAALRAGCSRSVPCPGRSGKGSITGVTYRRRPRWPGGWSWPIKGPLQVGGLSGAEAAELPSPLDHCLPSPQLAALQHSEEAVPNRMTNLQPPSPPPRRFSLYGPAPYRSVERSIGT